MTMGWQEPKVDAVELESRLTRIEVKIDGINTRLDTGNSKLAKHDNWIQAHDVNQARTSGWRSGAGWVTGGVAGFVAAGATIAAKVVFG